MPMAKRTCPHCLTAFTPRNSRHIYCLACSNLTRETVRRRAGVMAAALAHSVGQRARRERERADAEPEVAEGRQEPLRRPRWTLEWHPKVRIRPDNPVPLPAGMLFWDDFNAIDDRGSRGRVSRLQTVVVSGGEMGGALSFSGHVKGLWR